jgi:lipopolysaccharide transport system permease protein
MTALSTPVVRIRSHRRALDFSELWAYRDLLYFLVWRDVQVRYRQAALGILWALLQPLLTMAVFMVVFSRLASVPSASGVPYSLFAYAGLVPWIFVANAVSSSGNSLVGNAQIVSKVYFPRIIIPAAAALAYLVDFVVGLVPLFILMLISGIYPHPRLVLLLPLMVLTVLLAVSVGAALAALNVRYRDVRHALPFLTQLWMFASPVIYPLNAVPAPWQPLLRLNPMTGLLDAYRAVFFDSALDGSALGLTIVATAVLLPVSIQLFSAMEKGFADTL